MTVPKDSGRRLVFYLHDRARGGDWYEFNRVRRHMFELWLHGMLSDDCVVPFRDPWHDPKLFHSKRARLQRQAMRGIHAVHLPGPTS